MKVCLFDHHDYVIPTDGIGGVIGLFQILYEELRKLEKLHITIIVNEKSKLESDTNFEVKKLPFSDIEKLRFGQLKVSDFFDGDIFYTNSSGRHVNFNFEGYGGKWVSTCHGCQEWVGGSDCQVFVSNNQLSQHFRDNLFENYCNNYRVVHGVVDCDRLFFEDGEHDRLVWMGRIDGAKAERLYEIALHSNEVILAAGWYSPEWKWLFDKIMSTNKVEWVGKIEGDEQKRKFYSRAKLSIHCSTFEDPCPTTVLEAQSCGIPVISYANGSLQEIVLFKDLVYNDFNLFISKLNNFDQENYQRLHLKSFIEDNFSKKLYGYKFYKIFKETYESNRQ